MTDSTALQPEKYANLPKTHRRHAAKLTFVVTPHHGECADRTCLERQLRIRTRMKELIEIFEPGDVAEVDNGDEDARRGAGVPDLWSYDGDDDEHPVVPLDDLAIVDLPDGRRLVYAILDVAPAHARDMSAGMFQ